MSQGLFYYRGFTITLSRTSLDECSTQDRELYLTIHNTHKRQTSMPLVGFEPTIPASEWQQIHALNCLDTRISKLYYSTLYYTKQTVLQYTILNKLYKLYYSTLYYTQQTIQTVLQYTILYYTNCTTVHYTILK